MCSLHHESVKMRHLIFIYLFLLGGLVCVCDSVLNNALLGSLLWGYPSSNCIFGCSAVSSS